MHYFLIKIIHVISAAALVGGGLFLILYCLWAYTQKNTESIIHAFKLTIIMNIGLIAPCGLFQLLSGFAMIYLRTSFFTESWVVIVLTSYGLAILSWLIGIWVLGQCQQCIKNSHSKMRRYFLIWLVLCLINIASLVVVYYFMTKPALP